MLLGCGRNPGIKVLFFWKCLNEQDQLKKIALVRSLYIGSVCIFLKALVPIRILLETCSLNQYCSFDTAMSSYGSSKGFAKRLYCPNPHFCVSPLIIASQGGEVAAGVGCFSSCRLFGLSGISFQL